MAWATLLFVSVLCTSDFALGHDKWANGNPVPTWVKSACCGPDEAHHLDLSQVRKVKSGWRVEGITNIVPEDRVYPSQDGQVWGFWSPDNADAFVQCLFVPSSF
jgi:hypothetical protein